MAAVVATLIGVLLLLAVLYDAARLVTPREPRCPPLARLRGRKAALDAAEEWLVGLRMHGRVDAAEYERRMEALAHGERVPGKEGRWA
ncbi:hypothetical protein Stsp02_20310 [Streptomyces sp. NBRC 14336]|jgi:hypothetical protein|uniref:SHOCT domain-containing protein n=1 Tax=Streptomyces thermocarboxydovorans TaxID=59298 RepID=A0ABP3SLY0_9ACTN|nr:hypothetical protein [Streptomyces sp. NBRC 14336]GLW46369.1 hypothetical protein Stsp02_20310 [Streptomyces sp. NBRC 14336]